ncbi:hypothetical protein [Micromonospora zamorensis]|uniref:hypothetical protein n=1 Tax=Micromonospora zamorensis TaxID=709883 RepID=UPI0033DFA85D
MDDLLYRTIDFHPAQIPGWRACFINDDGSLRVDPVVGWLVQERYGAYRNGSEHVLEKPAEGYERRVVAATHSSEWEGRVFEVDFGDGFWKILPPDGPDPTSEEVAAQREYQQRKNASR